MSDRIGGGSARGDGARKMVALNLDGLVIMHEPVENAFSMLMPQGWHNDVQLQREQSLNRVIAVAVSPDKSTSISINDPRIPLFIEPSPMISPMMGTMSPLIQVRPVAPPEIFFRDHVLHFFGRAPGFRLLDMRPHEAYLQLKQAELLRYGKPARLGSVMITFEHQGGGSLTRCRLSGLIAHYAPQGFWTAELYWIGTSQELAPFDEMALRMRRSCEFRPEWVAAQEQLQRMQRQHADMMHQQTMQHIQGMTNLNTQGHYARMQGIADFGRANTQAFESRMAGMDANHQAWMAGQAQSDAQHQSWMHRQQQDDGMQRSRINAINEEHTVVDATGASYQVDIHHERYFVNKRDNTYIGAGATTELADLRKTYGVNPDDFEEVKIVR